jgi:IS30 family transposase
MTSKTYHQLTREQRYQIEALVNAGHSKAYIAQVIGTDRSTVYRELKRNSTRSLHPPDRYKAANAQRFAVHRAYRHTKSKSICPRIIRIIVWLISREWSPQQISQTCKQRTIPMLSTEAIYQWLYDQKANNTGYASLIHKLRRKHRRRRKRSLNKQPRVIIKEKVSITQRPQIVAEQQRSGDLETDLVKCTNGYLLTITDRKTLFNIIAKIPNKEAATVLEAITTSLQSYKGKIFTITSDNGTEFAKHAQAATELGIEWYFADPYRSQQRGCNENQNGLIRQYLTRKTDLAQLTDQYILTIQNKLNHRPRKKLNYTPPIKLFLQPPSVALVS